LYLPYVLFEYYLQTYILRDIT